MTPADHLWKRAPDGLRVDNAVHIFCAPLDVPAKRLEELVRPLSNEERHRADLFHVERDRQRFLAGRGTLREILGTLLGINPASLAFAYGEFGKPKIAAPDAARSLHFNLAHSDSIAVYAVASGELGVDVERIRPMDEAEQIASRFFTPREERCFYSVPGERRMEAFFNCWTRKEAYLKAIGRGLDDCLDQIEVSLVPGEPARLLAVPEESEPARRWLLESFSPAAEFTGAVVFQEIDSGVSCWRWKG